MKLLKYWYMLCSVKLKDCLGIQRNIILNNYKNSILKSNHIIKLLIFWYRWVCSTVKLK